MRYSLFSRQDAYSNKLCGQIKNILSQDKSFVYDDEKPELVICVGGDGTILRAIHHYIDRLDKTRFTGLHTGTLGFFTDYTKEESMELLEDILEGDFKEDTCSLLEIRPNHTDEVFYALNEIRLGSFINTVSYDVYIDGEFFEHTTGSGVCISTQAGSTAVTRALGGAVIDSGLEVLQFTEIMPITHNNHHSIHNPYIMRCDRKITITGESLAKSEGTYDHKEINLKGATAIDIQVSDKQVRFARFKPYSYLKRIKNLY